MKKWLVIILAMPILGLVVGSLYIANPIDDQHALPEPLRAFNESEAETGGPYWADFRSLRRGFKPQTYLSFCGPATLATVLRAYGMTADQRELFPSTYAKVDTFFTGRSLAELSTLASFNGLRNQIVYADQLTPETFRSLLVSNLAHAGDYIVVNYDRRVLKQPGHGHISAVAAYDAPLDRALILDEASYRFPFTWVPLTQLFDAIHTGDGQHFRGVLVIKDNAAPRTD